MKETLQLQEPGEFSTEFTSITSLDFSIGVYYGQTLQFIILDIETLSARITDALAMTTKEMLENTWEEISYCWDVCPGKQTKDMFLAAWVGFVGKSCNRKIVVKVENIFASRIYSDSYHVFDEAERKEERQRREMFTLVLWMWIDTIFLAVTWCFHDLINGPYVLPVVGHISCIDWWKIVEKTLILICCRNRIGSGMAQLERNKIKIFNERTVVILKCFDLHLNHIRTDMIKEIAKEDKI